MSSLVQKIAPSFSCQAVMADGTFQEVKLEDYRGKYVLLFFYPLDFTFVCPTEIIAFSRRERRVRQARRPAAELLDRQPLHPPRLAATVAVAKAAWATSPTRCWPT